jgi:plasmid replication initiation protein
MSGKIQIKKSRVFVVPDESVLGDDQIDKHLNTLQLGSGWDKDDVEAITIVKGPKNYAVPCRIGNFNDKLLVIKENLLINLPTDYTEHEQKIIAMVVSQIREKDNLLVPVKFTVEQIADTLDVAIDSLYSNMQKLVISIHRPVYHPYIHDRQLAYDTFPFFVLVSYKEGEIVFNINPRLNELLLGLQKNAGRQIAAGHITSYTKYPLKEHLAIKGKYALRLYEFICQHAFRSYVRILYDQLREMLKLEEKFDSYKAFKRWILMPAIEEINKKSCYFVDVGIHKSGKFYREIMFNIVEKDEAERLIRLHSDLAEFGLTQMSIEYIFSVLKLDIDDVENNIRYVHKLLERRKDIHCRGSYLYSAIINNYAGKGNKEAKFRGDTHIRRMEKLAQTNYLNKLKLLIDEYRSELERITDEYICKFKPWEILQDYVSNGRNSISKNLLIKHTNKLHTPIPDIFKVPLVRAGLKRYLLDNKLDFPRSAIEYLKSKGENVDELFLLQNGLI